MAESRTPLGEYLLELLQVHDVSQAELSRMSGISPVTINNTINKANTPTLDSLLKIAEALREDFWVLANMAGINVPPPVHRLPPAINALAQRLNRLPPVGREAAVKLLNDLLDGLETYDFATRHAVLAEIAGEDGAVTEEVIERFHNLKSTRHRQRGGQ